MITKWSICDTLNRPYFLRKEDKCIYLYEYYSGKGFEYENNQIVFNFKKPLDAKGQFYKQKAIEQFAQSLASTKWPDCSVMTAAATSKPSSSPQYDSRLEDVLQIFSQYPNAIPIIKCFDAAFEGVPAHVSGGSRSPELAGQNIRLLDFSIPTNTKQIFILDDVITTGSTFVAMKRLLLDKFPNLQVYGVFLAKAIRL